MYFRHHLIHKSKNLCKQRYCIVSGFHWRLEGGESLTHFPLKAYSPPRIPETPEIAYFVSSTSASWSCCRVVSKKTAKIISTRAGLFKAGLRQPRVSAKFKFRYESLKSKFSFILFAYNLMIGCSKKNRENYPGKCFWTKEKETPVKM